MSERVHTGLFLCTGNSARSILGEVLLNRLGRGRFRAFSAGSHPKGQVHPLTLDVLREHGEEVRRLRSKSWDEFARPGAPAIDFVLTVCDSAASEACPVWPGQPVVVHWGIADPAACTGSTDAQRRAFADTYALLKERIELLVGSELESLDPEGLRRLLRDIGKTRLPPAEVLY